MPSQIFQDLPSRLPVGVQLIDGAARTAKKALGTIEFINNPPERAALLQLTRDLDNLVVSMTRKVVGKSPIGEPDDGGDDVGDEA